MAPVTDKKVKLYYSIKEVAQMFDINESTLRFWETEFPQLKPRTQAGTKVRQYTEQDIEQVRLIYNLVKVRGFKLAAARKILQGHDSTCAPLYRQTEKLGRIQVFARKAERRESHDNEVDIIIIKTIKTM